MANTNSFTEEEQKRTKLLALSYWYVTHKVKLRRVGLGILIGMAAIFWLYALWGVLDLFVISYSRYKAMMNDLTSGPAYSQEWIRVNAPRPIDAGTARVFPSGEKFDFLAKISNESPIFWAEFNYKFTFAGGETTRRHGFILPTEEKWLAELAFSGTARPESAKLVLEDVARHRLDAHEVPDYGEWKNERFNFKITDIAQESALSLGKGTVMKTKFTVQNLSAYGYRSVGFYVIAYRGATPSGVNFVALSDFRSGETRAVEVSWFDSLAQVSKMEIAPEVNIFDEGNYLPL
ncbi:MAG: hypothetical protein PHW53_02615 [Patescibacteria group bacterium]|nr:hypothetical protein [Patescibacteria group bacterium]